MSEQTRLRQITSEIFVTEGLDAALNIDGESFNYGHPHLQLLTRWLPPTDTSLNEAGATAAAA